MKKLHEKIRGLIQKEERIESIYQVHQEKYVREKRATVLAYLFNNAQLCIDDCKPWTY